ncbi:MAG: helix-turn-helix domain-containing protein [Alphaproteobacteria bacterium]|nr:helix-turn-helix domain-containing protein [Alphaproteobacteria bacterium]
MNRGQNQFDWASFRELCGAVARIESPEEAEKFLIDLCTKTEAAALAERWLIARLLDEGKMSYREIASRTGASTATVTRVARFLFDEDHGGYRQLISQLSH